MERKCNLSKTAIKKYRSDIEKLLPKLFAEQRSQLNQSTDRLSSTFYEFSNWAGSRISENERLIDSAYESCTDKKSRLEAIISVTPVTITVGEGDAKREQHNPQFDINLNMMNRLKAALRGLEEYRTACNTQRKKIDEMSQKINSFLEQSTRVEYFIDECKQLASDTLERLAAQSDIAYKRLCYAMEEIAPLPAIKGNNGGTVDIDAVLRCCYSITAEIDSFEKQFKRLKLNCEAINSGWNDKVYKYFSDTVCLDISGRLEAVISELYSINSALQGMCDRLTEYYSADTYVDRHRISFSYDYIDIEQGFVRNVSDTFEI